MKARNGGERLRAKRKKLRLTQRELGFISGCSHAFIGMLERDETTVSEELAGQIAFRLGCDLEDIFVAHDVVRVERVPTRNVGGRRSRSVA